jgi:hypothetical protein
MVTLNKQKVSSDSEQLWPVVNEAAYASAYLSHCRAAKGSQRKPIRGPYLPLSRTFDSRPAINTTPSSSPD